MCVLHSQSTPSPPDWDTTGGLGRGDSVVQTGLLADKPQTDIVAVSNKDDIPPSDSGALVCTCNDTIPSPLETDVERTHALAADDLATRVAAEQQTTGDTGAGSTDKARYLPIKKRKNSKCLNANCCHLRTDTDHEVPRSHNLTEADIKRYMKKYDFTESQILEFEEAFLVFDLDGNGHVTVDELGTVMVALGQRPSLQELEALIRGVDNDNSGTVDLDEFLDMMCKRMHSDPEEELHEVFRVFDANGDGFISADELYDVLSRLDEAVTRDEVDGMIKEADTNGDGQVDFSEFKGILHAK